MVPSGRGRDFADNLEHEFAAGLVRGLKRLRRVGVDHHLHQPLAVAQIDENDAAVVTPPMRPAEQGDLLPEVLLVDKTTVVCSHDESQIVFPANWWSLSFRALL